MGGMPNTKNKRISSDLSLGIYFGWGGGGAYEAQTG